MGGTIGFLIAVGIVSAICYALITRADNAGRRQARAGNGSSETDSGTDYSGSNDYWLARMFSSENAASSVDSSGNPLDDRSCSFSSSDSASSDSSSDSGGGGDCGGGGSSD